MIPDEYLAQSSSDPRRSTELIKSQDEMKQDNEETSHRKRSKPNKTQRGDYSADKNWDDNFLLDLDTNNSRRKRGLFPTRNDHRRDRYGHRSNRQNYSSSSIFTYSQDDTLRSGQRRSKNFSREDQSEIGEGESDLSYLSQWQASHAAYLQTFDKSMSYDKEVLEQRSDPC